MSDEQEPVIIRDNRKVDRGPALESDELTSSAPEAAEVTQSEDARLLEERTADLQRLQAEYANYRKRAERERLAAGDIAVSRVLTDFVPVLDDLDRARVHGDLTGGLKAVADQLDAVFAKLGLSAFGTVGDPFDPEIHEAVMHNESADVSEATCTTVMRPGYKHGERLLRAAMVGVTDPATPWPETEAETAAETGTAPESETE
jgi:molecular chaperone GrpE